jgi:hypothetical protein
MVEIQITTTSFFENWKINAKKIWLVHIYLFSRQAQKPGDSSRGFKPQNFKLTKASNKFSIVKYIIWLSSNLRRPKFQSLITK